VTLVKCTVRDLLGQLTQRTMSPEGFLIAPGAIARAGNIQEYRASELGFDVTRGMDANAIVRLYRPTAEVHSQDTIRSFEGQTLTMGHPFGGVDAEGWRKVAVGDIRGVKAEGDTVTGELVIRDAAAIKDIQSGKRQLSCGYTFDCDMTAGHTADGKAYDGTMTSIRGNHVAIVDAARGGPGLRIADSKHKGNAMKIRMVDRALAGVTLPGFSIVVDDAAGEVAQDAVDRHVKACDAATTAHDAIVADRDAQKARADAAEKELAELKTKKTAADTALAEANKKVADLPVQIESLAAERAKVVGDAARLAPDVKAEGKTVAAIRAEVVTAVLAGDTALKGVASAMLDGLAVDKAPAEAVTAAFKAIASVPAADGHSANDYDAEVGRRLSDADGDKSRANDGAPVLTGRALMIFRQTHGGRSPSEVAAQARS
jgi:hypothetical protein